MQSERKIGKGRTVFKRDKRRGIRRFFIRRVGAGRIANHHREFNSCRELASCGTVEVAQRVDGDVPKKHSFWFFELCVFLRQAFDKLRLAFREDPVTRSVEYVNSLVWARRVFPA